MNPSFARILCGAALAVAVTCGPAVAQTAEPSEGPRHLPMKPHLNADGSFKRGLQGQVTTENWSGYAVTAGAPYTSASATWQVPNASYDGGNTPYGYEYVFNWVGIGGYGDATLIQLGTESVVSTSGARSFYVWYELYPDVALPISRAVKPGDIITASLECTAACSPSSVQTWLLTISDETAGWTWMQTFQYQSSMASACRSPIETSLASPIEMSHSTVGVGLVGVAWDDGDHDEPRRADTPAGADRYR